MADNIGITPGTGATSAADDIGGILFQRVKLAVGADGVNDGDVAVGNPMPVSFPLAESAVIMTLTTSSAGTSYTSFSSQTCDALDLTNSSSVAIEYRRGGTGNAMQVLSGASRLIVGISNANAIDVRRVDTSTTQITIQAEALTA
jgi:hypothetical protein